MHADFYYSKSAFNQPFLFFKNFPDYQLVASSIEFKALFWMHESLQKTAATYLQSMLASKQSIHNFYTSTPYNLRVPGSIVTAWMGDLAVYAPRLWNSLSYLLKNIFTRQASSSVS